MPTVKLDGERNIECTSIEEGDEGLVLKNEDEIKVGWVPFDDVVYVRP